jgi:hypothetical protein
MSGEPVAHMQSMWASMAASHCAEQFVGNVSESDPGLRVASHLWK